MLGFELMLNFDHPYLAKKPFWSSGDDGISLSPLGFGIIYTFHSAGHVVEKSTRLKASYGAMLISGLWHGAWSFVLWGAYHATLLAGYRHIGKKIPRSFRKSTWVAPFLSV